jgi:hypothetical protein
MAAARNLIHCSLLPKYPSVLVFWPMGWWLLFLLKLKESTCTWLFKLYNKAPAIEFVLLQLNCPQGSWREAGSNYLLLSMRIWWSATPLQWEGLINNFLDWLMQGPSKVQGLGCRLTLVVVDQRLKIWFESLSNSLQQKTHYCTGERTLSIHLIGRKW